MSEIIDYNGLKFEMADGFHVMDRIELMEHIPGSDPERMAIWNPDEHVLIAFHRKPINPIIGKFASKKTMSMRLISDMKKANPGLEISEEYTLEAAGDTRYGFRYEYTAKDIPHIGDILAIVEKGTYYTMTCSYRAESKEYGEKAFSELIKSCSFE